MHRDPTRRKRNALVIPGVLLVLLCLTGIAYAQTLRPDEVTCEDGHEVFFLGACRSATLLLVIPLALGAVLIGLGASVRSRTKCHLGHGTVATTGLAVLVAAAVLPALAAFALSSIEDPDAPYVLAFGEVDYSLPFLLSGAAAIGVLMLVPYLALYLGTARPLACCRQRSCFDPCYCDEVPAPAPTLAVPEEMAEETAQVTTSAWPPQQDRTRPALVPISAPLVPEPTPAPPPPEAEAPPADPWPTLAQDFQAPVEAPPLPEEPKEAPEAPDMPSETRTDAWPAASPPADPASAPKEEPVWTMPEPVDAAPKPRGSAAKGKAKPATKPAKGKDEPTPEGTPAPAKKTRRVTGKKKP